jgi:hypothetical protein
VWLLEFGADGALSRERRLEWPVDYVRGALRLPGDRVALCGNGRTMLMGFVGVYAVESGDLIWSANVPGTAQALAHTEDTLFVAVKESRAVFAARSEASGPSLGALLPLPGEIMSAAIRDLVVAKGLLFSIGYEGKDSNAELEVRDCHTLRSIARLRLREAGNGHLAWDPETEGLWIVTPNGALRRRIVLEPSQGAGD